MSYQFVCVYMLLFKCLESVRFFHGFEINVLCSLRMHLFNQKCGKTVILSNDEKL